MQVKNKDDKKTIPMKLVEEIPLPNGLVVEVYDKSRPIALDTTKVEVYSRVKITLDPSFFSHQEHYEKVKKVFGDELYYEHTNERTFVNNNDREAVFQELLKTLKKDVIPYLSKPSFPSHFALSKYAEIEKHWYRYRSYFEEEPPEEEDDDRPFF